MSWILLLQLVILMVLAAVLVGSTIGYTIDKRREDAHHRKENGL